MDSKKNDKVNGPGIGLHHQASSNATAHIVLFLPVYYAPTIKASGRGTIALAVKELRALSLATLEIEQE